MSVNKSEPTIEVSDEGSASNVAKSGGVRENLSIGAFIFAVTGFFLKIIGIIALAILGRVLTPADLAIGAYCLFATGLLTTIIIRPFELALIRLQKVEETHLSTVFTMRALLGAVCAVILFFSANPIASLVNAEELSSVFKVIAICPLFNGLFNPAYALYAKNLRFGPEALQDIVPRLTFNAVAISAALYWQSYWALVMGYVLSELARSLTSYLRTPPVSGFGLQEWRYFFRFTRWVIATHLMRYVNRRVDQILVAPGLGLTTAGLYRVGRDLSELSTVHLVRPINRVIYPGLASISKDPEKLASAYLRLQAMTLGIVFPTGIFLSITASDLLRVVMGSQWLDAAPVVAFLAPIWAIMTINAGTSALVYIKDEAWTLFTRDVIALVITVPTILIGIRAGGFMGVIIASFFSNCVFLFMSLLLAARCTGTSVIAPFLNAWRYVLSGIIMAVALLILKGFIPETTAQTPLIQSFKSIVAYLFTGGAFYLGACFISWFAAGRPDGLERFGLSIVSKVSGAILKKVRRQVVQ